MRGATELRKLKHVACARARARASCVSWRSGSEKETNDPSGAREEEDHRQDSNVKTRIEERKRGHVSQINRAASVNPTLSIRRALSYARAFFRFLSLLLSFSLSTHSVSYPSSPRRPAVA